MQNIPAGSAGESRDYKPHQMLGGATQASCWITWPRKVNRASFELKHRHVRLVEDLRHSLCSVLSTRLEKSTRRISCPLLRQQTLPLAKVEISLHILVADDVADCAEALACLLRVDGHSVSVALGGAHAIALSAAVHPQVAVLDICMPDIDGYSVATSIRRSEWGQAVHLIAFSGLSDRHSRQRAAAAGFDLYVVKPIDPLPFLKQINELEGRLCQLPG